MTLDEYRQLSLDAKAGRGQGACRDALGNLDIWLSFKGRWVCAAMKPGADTISTFLPAPPDFKPDVPVAPAEGPRISDTLRPGPSPVPAAKIKAVVIDADMPLTERMATSAALAALRSQNARQRSVIDRWTKAEEKARHERDSRTQELTKVLERAGRQRRQVTRVKRECQEAAALVMAGDLLGATRKLYDISSMPLDADPETWVAGERG